jgi:hypothetical protein
LLSVAFVAALVGCGKEDPNKNLKPVDPNAKPPKIVTDKGNADRPTTPP